MHNKETSPLSLFLDLAACSICGGKLHASRDRQTISCEKNAHHWFKTNQWGFFEFGRKDEYTKYDDEEFAESYIADAYGYCLINRSEGGGFVGLGQPEGLYRTTVQLALAAAIEKGLVNRSNVKILDLACGVGRRVASVAKSLPNAFVVGLDYSVPMIKFAREIILGSGNFSANFAKYGFGTPSMKRFSLVNVFLAQADARQPPFRSFGPENNEEGFDIVFNCMLVDRISTCAGVEAALKNGVALLKDGGSLIFACPFNWISEEAWERYGWSRSYIPEFLEEYGLEIVEAFDGLVYRELMDPHGTHLELPVLVLRGERHIRL